MGTSGYSPYSKDCLPYNWRNFSPIKASSIRSPTSSNLGRVIIFRCLATNIATKTNVIFFCRPPTRYCEITDSTFQTTFTEEAISRCPETQRRHCTTHTIYVRKHIKGQPKILLICSCLHGNMCESGSLEGFNLLLIHILKGLSGSKA